MPQWVVAAPSALRRPCVKGAAHAILSIGGTMSRREFRATLPIALLALFVGATCGDESTPTPPDRRPGGSLSGSVVRDGIEYRADVLVMESFPVQLSGRATLKNTSSETRTVSFPDGCVALLRAYASEGGGPVWDQAGGL